MKTMLLIICLLLASGVLLAGCGYSAAVFPVGAYVAHGTDGEYILDFEKEGTYTAILAGETEIASGSYRPADGTITFTAAPPCAEEATYLWVREGEKLTFEISGEDSCAGRRAYLQDLTYTCVSCA